MSFSFMLVGLVSCPCNFASQSHSLSMHTGVLVVHWLYACRSSDHTLYTKLQSSVDETLTN